MSLRDLSANSILSIIASIVVILSPRATYAARAHDIVERIFVLKGDQARRAAELLDIPTEMPFRISLPWNRQAFTRNCSWGQPKDDSSIKRCEDIVVPVNKIIYATGSEPELRFEGHWMDESTGSGAKFNRFSFGMSLPPPSDVERSDWEKLDQAFNKKVNLAKRGERGELVISTSEDSNPRLILTRYRGEGSSTIYISIDFDTPTQRAAKEVDYKACQSQNGNLEGGC